MTTVTRSITFATKGRRKRAVVATSPNAGRTASDECQAETAAVGRVPRVARLMALAIRFDQLLRDGIVANQTELAKLARVTQPRMTQIMNLLHLAPDIQEAILFLPHVNEGRDPITERDLRVVARHSSWMRQQRCWKELVLVSQ
ncbi:MAG: hypothetical protein KF724_02165 [Phycisphaeraceae bacterium]|nr:hypothetical protein [Phycisphaeraceae bacterium]